MYYLAKSEWNQEINKNVIAVHMLPNSEYVVFFSFGSFHPFDNECLICHCTHLVGEVISNPQLLMGTFAYILTYMV